MKNYLLIIITIAVFVSTFVGCKKMVNSYTRFSIEEFDDFFNITDISSKESYIKNGNMEFAKIGDLIICPFIKETTHEECSLFVYVYTSNKNSNPAIVNSVMLSTQNGIILSEKDTMKQPIELTSASNTLMSGVAVISSFEKNEAWFYSGNELQLSLQITVNDETTIIEKNISYTVKLIEHKRHIMPT